MWCRRIFSSSTPHLTLIGASRGLCGAKKPEFDFIRGKNFELDFIVAPPNGAENKLSQAHHVGYSRHGDSVQGPVPFLQLLNFSDPINSFAASGPENF